MHNEETRLATYFRNEIQNIRQDILISEINGGYRMFNTFDVIVGSPIVVNYNQLTKKFNNLKTAFAWCLLEFNRKWIEANRLLQLDLKYESILFSIATLKQKLRNSPDEIIKIKLYANEEKLVLVQREIDRIIKHAINIQRGNFPRAINNRNYRIT